MENAPRVPVTPRDNDRFLAEVEDGLAAARREEFIEEDEMNARAAAMLKPPA